ncbi:hypothetical protein U1Q18_015159, partial [Sarracenia purpurea var. burkii]
APTPFLSPGKLTKHLHGLTAAEITLMVYGEFLDIPRFIDCFFPTGSLEELSFQLRRCFTLCASILVGYLLVRADDGVNSDAAPEGHDAHGPS